MWGVECVCVCGGGGGGEEGGELLVRPNHGYKRRICVLFRLQVNEMCETMKMKSVICIAFFIC